MQQADVAMSDASSSSKLDEDLYSRQLYVMGHDAMNRMRQSNVLIVGLNGLGVETAKNIILAGVKSVSLLDQTAVEMRDLGSQFYLSEADIGKQRAAVSATHLAELNRYCPVAVVDQPLSQQLLATGKYQVVVCIDVPVANQLEINKFCHENQIKFIAADVKGLFSTMFVDFGPQFTVFDKNGERPAMGTISSVSQETPAAVTVVDDSRHGLEDGDVVRFEEISGMSELNGREFRVQKVTGPFAFTIDCDATAFGAYETGGLFAQVKQPQTVQFKPLHEAIDKPEFVVSDFMKFERPAQLHCLYRALSEFGQRPKPDSQDDILAIVDLAQAHATKAGIELDEKVMAQLARCAGAVIAPMCAFMGGVVGQEVLKACSGKFSPTKQFLYFDAVECLPDGQLDASEFGATGSRYDDYVAIFGRSLQAQVEAQKLFLVGAGAIGCEMLKNWALMGIGTHQDGHVTVTDMDTIERSNLNRQFLFRQGDIGEMKSTTAAKAVQVMNPAINITARADRVGQDTESVFNDQFWNGLSGVCTALDNVDARLYVDQRCVYYQKPMLESGTLGTKGNTQVVVPFVTESYGSSRDPPEQGIPICTLKNFPHKIEHTVQWARDVFEGWFKQAPDEVNSYLTSGDKYLDNLRLQQNNQLEILGQVKDYLVTDKPLSFDECVVWARLQFEQEYNHKIRQLLHNFPADSTTSSGALFWSGTKRCPAPIDFDPSDDTHLQYIVSAANLRAYNYGLNGKPAVQRQWYETALSRVMVPDFAPKRGVKIATTEAEAKQEATAAQQAGSGSMADQDRVISALEAALPNPASLAGFRLHGAEFEKDDATNFHVSFITAASNLRARSYTIKEATEHETKGIAGKIIPAIATTTALVTGLICLEFYKVVQHKPIEQFKNGFVNLALPLFAFSEPIAPPTNKAQLAGKENREWQWSLWDRIDVDQGDLTMGQFLEHFETTYGLEVNMLSFGASILYAFFGNKQKIERRKTMPLSKVIEEIQKKPLGDHEQYIVLEACVNDDDGEDVEIPYIRCKLR